jgi:hypothetical protein
MNTNVVLLTDQMNAHMYVNEVLSNLIRVNKSFLTAE